MTNLLDSLYATALGFLAEESEPVEPLHTSVQKNQTWHDSLEALLHIQYSSHIKLAVEVLGLACGMQFHEMQDYLRERADHISPINVVGELAHFLHDFRRGEQFHFKSFSFDFIEEVSDRERTSRKWR